jgi:hypothetical protein
MRRARDAPLPLRRDTGFPPRPVPALPRLGLAVRANLAQSRVRAEGSVAQQLANLKRVTGKQQTEGFGKGWGGTGWNPGEPVMELAYCALHNETRLDAGPSPSPAAPLVNVTADTATSPACRWLVELDEPDARPAGSRTGLPQRATLPL